MKILGVLSKVMLLAVLVSLVGGCCITAQDEIQKLTIMNKEQQKALIDKDAEIARLQERIGWLEQNIKSLNADLASKLADRAKLEQEIAALRDALAKRDQAFMDLANRIASQPARGLPKPVEMKLEALAKANPDVFSYDPQTGQLRFKADVTFDSGDDTVKPAAQDVLAKLATILDDQAAMPIMIAIIGHTDNQKVAKPETVKKFGTNQKLSEARAESVKAVLAKAGVNDSRMATKGMGDTQPIADNATKDGREKNRRVEIYLRMPEGAAGAMAPSAPAGEMKAPPMPVEPKVPAAPAGGSGM